MAENIKFKDSDILKNMEYLNDYESIVYGANGHYANGAFYNLNKNQASGIIRLLSGISFYNQRAMLTKSIEILKNREDFAMILHEIKLNIHQKA